MRQRIKLIIWCSFLFSIELTNVCFFEPRGRDLVIDVLVAEEVEGLEDVEEEVSQVVIHVDREDPAVKAVDGTTSVHHLGNVAGQPHATCTTPTRRMASQNEGSLSVKT